MGLSLGIAVKIFTNPGDLQFVVFEDRMSKKYGFMINRGPGDRFNPLLTADPVFKTKGDAVRDIGKILETIIEVSSAEFANPASLTAMIINPDNLPIAEANGVMTSELVMRIITDLNDKGVSETYS